jgi:hypothetical protein
MSDQQRVTVPYFRPLGADHGIFSEAEERRMAAEASRVASEEEAAYLKALGGPRHPKSELPPLKAPVLSADFGQRLEQLDDKITSKGVGIDSDKLLELGKERFTRLLELDRKIPRHALGAGIDATRFDSVQSALHAFEAASVPRRTTNEQLEGAGKEREAIRQITGWPVLWKAAHERQEVIADFYSFHDLFESLTFGQSMLEKVSRDGRLRGPLFRGGKQPDYFHDWLSVLVGPLTSVTLVRPLWSLIFWLAEEKTPAPSLIDLAKDFFSVRAPSLAQIKLAQTVIDGFLLGYRDWPLWEFVGTATRTVQDEGRLASWRKALAARHPRIAGFHSEHRAFFYRDVSIGDVRYTHREFDHARYRAFIDRTAQELLDQASALLALGIDETFPGAVVARFQGSVLMQGEHKPMDKRASIGKQLAAAFPAFQLELEESQP